jgi:hypothetical protein
MSRFCMGTYWLRKLGATHILASSASLKLLVYVGLLLLVHEALSY